MSGRNRNATCGYCGRPIPGAVRPHARYCPNGRCRQSAYRARRFRAELLAATIAERSPAERLRAALAELRSRGEPFDEAWPIALVVAGGGGAWRETFAEQRHVWLAEFERRASTSPLAARAPTEHPVPRHLPGRLAA